MAQGWSNPLPSLLPVAEPLSLDEDESSSETGFIAEYGFGPPLNTRKEAEYFMHFIHELAPWFDVCDPARNFGTEVPKRARHFPFLAYSILAFSSRQISLKAGIDDDSHETYHSHALRILIPILDDPIGAVNENVLAGIVILRSYEETTGSSRLLNSEFRFAAQGGLEEAASWVVLRQDMYVSLTRSRPLRTNMDSYRDSQSFVDTCDESLANRVVFICGRVLAYAFGPESRLDPVLWVELGEDLRRWYETTPWKVLSFSPDSPAREGGEPSVFPTLWMARHIQVLGYQHYYIARMLLNIFNPQLWTPRFNAIRSTAASDEVVREDLRTLLGLTIS
ncbi:Zn 2cys6 transcription factor, partial [Fusarium albosuccineum]